jgi:hypothetical protein
LALDARANERLNCRIKVAFSSDCGQRLLQFREAVNFCDVPPRADFVPELPSFTNELSLRWVGPISFVAGRTERSGVVLLISPAPALRNDVVNLYTDIVAKAAGEVGPVLYRELGGFREQRSISCRVWARVGAMGRLEPARGS